MKKILFSAVLLAAFCVHGENLLSNSSFEEVIPLKKGKWKVELVKDWTCNLNSGAPKCDISLVEPGYKSKQAIRLHTLGKSGFNSVIHNKLFEVSKGQKITASVMLKGNEYGYIRIYYFDKEGKRFKNYAMRGIRGKENFAQLVLKDTIPEGVAKISFSLETLRNDADIIFDDAKLEIEPVK